ncbi:hypothetical protein [Rheinheimera gaetbuli]
MKLLSVVALTLLVGSTVSPAVTGSDEAASSLENSKLNGLYACTLFPLCDFDIYSPAPQPTDKKIDTQDKAKDDKVA